MIDDRLKRQRQRTASIAALARDAWLKMMRGATESQHFRGQCSVPLIYAQSGATEVESSECYLCTTED